MLGDQHPLKAFILVWNGEKDHFTGLIHLEQVSMAWLTTYSGNTVYVLDLQALSFVFTLKLVNLMTLSLN